MGSSVSCRCLLDVLCQQRAPLVSSAMAYRPCTLADMTRRRPFLDTRHLVVIRRKLWSDRVTVDCGEVFQLFLK